MTSRLERVAAGAVLAALLQACTAPVGTADTWQDLESSFSSLAPSQRAAAVEQFVAGHQGTPIVEDDTRLIFLVHHDATVPPRIVGDFNAWAAIPGGVDPSVGTMRRIEGTWWWYLEGGADADARIEYAVVFDETDVRTDPLNPHVVSASAGPHSEVRMPRWTPQPEIDDRGPVPAGAVVASSFESRELSGSRRVWYYLPPGYETSEEMRYSSAYVLDGGNYVERMDVPGVLDRLIAAGTVPPVVAVFVEPNDRVEEYGRSAEWLRFMTEELVPTVTATYGTRPEAAHRLIIGSSYGAVGAVRLALQRPDIFGRTAAIAPPGDAVTALASRQSDAPSGSARRWFVLGGRFDHLLDDARRFRDLLDESGEDVTYIEVPEGHSAETFRGHLDDAVRALLAGSPDAESR